MINKKYNLFVFTNVFPTLDIFAECRIYYRLPKTFSLQEK